MNYSTSEQALGQKWIDGKDMFRKVIDLGALAVYGWKDVAHGIEDLDLVVRMAGRAFDGVNHIPLPHVHRSDSAKGIQVQVDDTSVRVYSGVDRSAFEGTMILIYTKKDPA